MRFCPRPYWVVHGCKTTSTSLQSIAPLLSLTKSCLCLTRGKYLASTLLTESMIWLSVNFDLFIHSLFHWKKFYFSGLWFWGPITIGKYCKITEVYKFRLLKNELARFVFAGILNTLLTLAVFSGAIFLGLPYIVANVISWVIGILFSYSLNTFFVFDKIHSIQRLLWFFSTYVVSLFLSTLMLIIFIESYQMNPISAQFIALPLIILFNYMASKYVIFRN